MFGFTRWKVSIICLIGVIGMLMASVNLMDQSFLDKLPNWLPKEKVNLGLDLQGGSHLLLEVDFDAVIKENIHNLQDSMRVDLRKASIATRKLETQDNHVIVELEDASNGQKVKELAHKIDPSLEVIVGGDGVVKIGYSPIQLAQRKHAILDQSLEIVHRRVDETGTKEPSIQSQGDNQILVQLPGLKDPARIKELIGKTAKMTFHLVDENTSLMDAEAGRIPPGSMIVKSYNNQKPKIVVQKRAQLSGDSLVNAKPDFNQDKGWVLAFQFDSKGSRKFAEITSKNINKRFAILLDNQYITDPVINGVIPSGSGIIEGGFTAQSAHDLAVLMRAGALPAPLKVVEERTVGADLGADSIQAGKTATILGLVFVVVFMVVYYGLFGFIADLGVVLNLVLTIAVFGLIGATLTLPGIAGIVLAMGMAVDANVLINERIDEEIRAGKSVIGAIEAGYRRALTSIIDSNLTTIIAAALLYYFGSGPIKAFAVTLSIGLLISMFTAITFTRMLIAGWWWKFRPSKLKIHVLRFIPPNTKINFMGQKKFALIMAGLISLGAIGIFAVKNFNYGVDFKGGILIEVRTKEAADLGVLRNTLNNLELGDVSLQEFGSPKDILIRAENKSSDEKAQMKIVDAIKQSINAAHKDAEYRRVDFVGPKVSSTLFTDAFIAFILSLLAIMIYVWIRFDWQFGLCALLSLVHDLVAVIGFISLMGIEFNLTVVAAILTILGYSINDTVIIFDRVRENLEKHKDMSVREIINLSLNDTLSRTIMTVVTVLLVLVALALFGGSVLHGFSLTLIFGLIVGTYSSIYVSAMPLNFFKLKRKADREEEEADIGFKPS
jgi:SecD/SecF fusion protein